MNLPQAADRTRVYNSYYRVTEDFRLAPGFNFPTGASVKVAPRDLQQWVDMATVQPTLAANNDPLGVGIVADDTTAQTANNNALTRGSQIVRCVIFGYHPGALIDQSGTNAIALTHGIALSSSESTAGRLEGHAAAYNSTLAFALLPQAGVGAFVSTIGAGALAQSAGTITLTGTPAAGNLITVNIQAPYSQSFLGVAQYFTTMVTLTTAQAATVTTAAAAVAAALNASPAFAAFFIATSNAGVVTITVNALSSQFAISHPNGDFYSISLSGSVGNSVTYNTTGTTGSTVATTGGATLTGGTGFYGQAPVWVAFN